MTGPIGVVVGVDSIVDVDVDVDIGVGDGVGVIFIIESWSNGWSFLTGTGVILTV